MFYGTPFVARLSWSKLSGVPRRVFFEENSNPSNSVIGKVNVVHLEGILRCSAPDLWALRNALAARFSQDDEKAIHSLCIHVSALSREKFSTIAYDLDTMCSGSRISTNSYLLSHPPLCWSTRKHKHVSRDRHHVTNVSSTKTNISTYRREPAPRSHIEAFVFLMV
jgi:hypothetical protein